MKKQLLIILVFILGFNAHAQDAFKKGYFISNSNKRTICLIQNLDWNNNPTEIDYKLSESDIPTKMSISLIKEFGIDNTSKYINSIVKIDRSASVLDKLSTDRNPTFEEEELFLKVLIEGKASLYEYLDSGLTRYFYKVDQKFIEPLVFKNYKTAENNIAKNESFKQQLMSALKCSSLNKSNFNNLSYYKKDLVRIFTEYYKCHNDKLIYSEPRIERKYLNIGIRPRINNSSLTLENSGFNSRDLIDFGNKVGFGIGLEAEIVLPIKKNKWSIILEPTFQSYKAETLNEDVSVIFRGEIKSKTNYKSIEIPLGLRHYLLLNENSKIFVNASYVFDFTKSSFEFERSDTPNTNTVDLDTVDNLAFGIGYTLNNKFSLEMRYQLSRELVKRNSIWSSDYKTISVIFGYSLFN